MVGDSVDQNRQILGKASNPQKERFLIRNFEAGNYFETFLVSAVATILVIRLFLKLTGYPTLGGESLHIAHLFWGGLLMLAALLIDFSFLGKSPHQWAAILGGTGFGAFIDEMGKFFTRDNDYFFQPAVALIYITFVVIFFISRTLYVRTTYSNREYLMNTLREIEEMGIKPLDVKEKIRMLHYLEKSNPDHSLVGTLRDLINKMDLAPPVKPGPYSRMKHFLRYYYYRIARLPGFPTAVVIFFLLQLVAQIAHIFILVFFVGLGMEQILDIHILGRVAAKMTHLSFIDWARLVCSWISAAFVLLGIVTIWRSRVVGFQMFERSVLVSICLTQIFVFYQEQFSALFVLSFNILLLVTLRFMIEREKTRWHAASEAGS